MEIPHRRNFANVELLIYKVMNKYCVLFCIVILFLFSCKREKDKSVIMEKDQPEVSIFAPSLENVKEIKFNPHGKGYFYDELIDSVSFVKLETTDENLIGHINYLLFTKDNIIAVDRGNSKTVTVYDKQGRFLNKISRLGQAPDEYAFLSYVTLTPDSSQVVIMDTGNMTLKYFYLNDNGGQLTGSSLAKTEHRPYTFSNMEFITDQLVIGYYDAGNEIPGTPDKPTFIITDLNGKVYYSQYKSYYSNKFHYSTGYPLHRFGSNIYFNPPFNDTIFEVNKNSFKAKYAFNIAGGNHLHIDETTTDDDFREQMRNIDYFNSHFIDLKDVAVFHYMSNVDYLTWGVYVKSEDRTYENNGKCKNPLFSFFHIPWFYYGDNTIVVPVSASKIVGARNDILQKCDSKLAELLLDGLTEDDNPILLFYHMKTKMQ